jgi:hypothetical protein
MDQPTFDKIKEFIESDLFDDKFFDDRSLYTTSTSQIIGYIYDHVKEEITFPIDKYQKIEEFLLFMVQYSLTERDYELTNRSDPLMYIINQEYGFALFVLFTVEAKMAKNHKSDQEVKWSPEFERFLEVKFENRTHQISFLIGIFLYNIGFMNKDWLMQKLKFIFDLTSEFWLDSFL